MGMRARGTTRIRSFLVVALAMFVAVALTVLYPIPVGAAGEPVPPFDDETWRIDITHSDEYWLNVRYLVFPPGWSYDDTGFSGAYVTGHSGCGEAYAPMLLNTAYAAEGEHEIIVHFGGYCAHSEDSEEETKYDRYPNGTQIFVDATLDHFLPGETTPVETIPLSGTVIVTTDAPPPVWLWSIAVSGVEAQTNVPDTTTSSSTTTGAAGDSSGASGGEQSDIDAAGGSEGGSPAFDVEGGLSAFGLIFAVVLLAMLLGVGITLSHFLRGRSVPPGQSSGKTGRADPPPASAQASAEPEPVAEEHVTEAFLDMASGTIGQLAPSSPPKGNLMSGRTWVWVTHPLDVDYSTGGYLRTDLVKNQLQPGRWYQASRRNSYNSCTVWTEDGEHMLGDKVHDVRPAPDQSPPPSTRS